MILWNGKISISPKLYIENREKLTKGVEKMQNIYNHKNEKLVWTKPTWLRLPYERVQSIRHQLGVPIWLPMAPKQMSKRNIYVNKNRTLL